MKLVLVKMDYKNILQRKNTISSINDFQVLSLNSELNQFLSEYAGANLLVNVFERKLQSDNIDELWASHVFTLDEIRSSLKSLQDDMYFQNALPNAKLIPIIETLGSDLICAVSSPDPNLHGKIYVFDWDFRATYQADSLADFMAQLQVLEEV